MERILYLLVAFALLLFDGVHTSMTVCDCKNTVGGCQQGAVQKGSCTVGGVKFPRCCKTTGVDDHCECKGSCLSHEYQKDDCTGGYVCCPRTMRGYDVHPQ